MNTYRMETDYDNLFILHTIRNAESRSVVPNPCSFLELLTMRTILLTIALLVPTVATAQTIDELMREVLADNKPFYAPQPMVPVVPVVPMYPPNAIPNNPYGTGYSVVTTERTQPDYIQRYLGDRDATTHTTTTRVVPNNAWGQPIRPLNPFWP